MPATMLLIRNCGRERKFRLNVLQPLKAENTQLHSHKQKVLR